MDQAVLAGRIAESPVRGVVVEEIRFPGEAVRSRTLEALFGAEGVDDQPGGGVPGVVEGAGVTGCLPVTVGKQDRVAERIDFPFPLT